ncbi:MAG: F0F1 ATP synthase subunit B [Alphaproteobacteria bacterium]|nr:F0F1 ATP synthase subunit B [Alphaproteobacteria bacterium]
MDLMHNPTFWVMVAFVVFVIAVFKPIRAALTGALDGKIDQIRNEIDEAQRLREEAQAALASYQRKQRDAAQEVEAMMARAKAEAEAYRKSAENALATMLQRQEQLAQEKIQQAEAAAIQEIRDRAVTVALSATVKLLEEKLSGYAGDQLIDEAIKTLPNRLH